MEDAATAEISRSQVWQWIRHAAVLNDGRKGSRELVRTLIKEELAKIENMVGSERFASGKFDKASDIFENMMVSEGFPEFMPLIAYEQLD
jgi:malate synthase